MKPAILAVISKCYLRGVRHDDKSESVSGHQRRWGMEPGAVSERAGRVISMTSEEDKYTRVDELLVVWGGAPRFQLSQRKMHNHFISHTT